LNSRCKHSSK